MLIPILTLVLLGASAVFSAFGIWWTARPIVHKDPGDDGDVTLILQTTRWGRIRGVLFLGIGLLLNTVAAVIGAVQALTVPAGG